MSKNPPKKKQSPQWYPTKHKYNNYILPRPEPNVGTGGLFFWAIGSYAEVGKLSRTIIKSEWLELPETKLRKRINLFEVILCNLIRSALFGTDHGMLIPFGMNVSTRSVMVKTWGRDNMKAVLTLLEPYMFSMKGVKSLGKAKGLTSLFWPKPELMTVIKSTSLVMALKDTEIYEYGATSTRISKDFIKIKPIRDSDTNSILEFNTSTYGHTQELQTLRDTLQEFKTTFLKSDIVIDKTKVVIGVEYPHNSSRSKEQFRDQYKSECRDSVFSNTHTRTGDTRIRDTRTGDTRTQDIPSTTQCTETSPKPISPPNSQSNIQKYSPLKLSSELMIFRAVYKGNYSLGGRLYSCLQSLPQAARFSITIDGEESCELDFKALHPNLLYSLRKLRCPKDAYADPKIPRALMKMVALTSFNSSNRNKAIWSAIDETITLINKGKLDMKVEDITYIRIEAALTAFQKLHIPIAQDFFQKATKIGLRLQRWDSRIAAKVVKHFTDKGILCLPVHDSFIVKAKYQDELKHVMEQAYYDVMDMESPAIDRKDNE